MEHLPGAQICNQTSATQRLCIFVYGQPPTAEKRKPRRLLVFFRKFDGTKNIIEIRIYTRFPFQAASVANIVTKPVVTSSLLDR
jgi:hypothetical protein